MILTDLLLRSKNIWPALHLRLWVEGHRRLRISFPPAALRPDPFRFVEDAA